MKAELFRFLSEGPDDPLTVMRFVLALPLVDILVTLGQQCVDEPGQLMGAGGDRTGPVHAGA